MLLKSLQKISQQNLLYYLKKQNKNKNTPTLSHTTRRFCDFYIYLVITEK